MLKNRLVEFCNCSFLWNFLQNTKSCNRIWLWHVSFLFQCQFLGQVKEWLLARRLESPSCHVCWLLTSPAVCGWGGGAHVEHSGSYCWKGGGGGPSAAYLRVPVVPTCPWGNMDDFSRLWRSLSPLIVLTIWSPIPRLAVFISDFRNHGQLCLAVLMGSLTMTGLLSTASSWPSSLTPPSIVKEFFTSLISSPFLPQSVLWCFKREGMEVYHWGSWRRTPTVLSCVGFSFVYSYSRHLPRAFCGPQLE